ncbi:MAG: hypothetical protein J7497_16645, partial [Chitinophagaceae bacterium]|nr:hypothetical protein [Chitinophagaceae bacterium]
ALVYYMDAKDWINFGKYYKKYFELAVLNDRSYLHINNISWNVVEHVTDTAVLATAVNTMKYDIERFDGNDYPSIDTYANLLYKIGRREEAIQWEEKAVKLSNNDKSYMETLEKMKNNQPTW